jgi:hypothetical protein
MRNTFRALIISSALLPLAPACGGGGTGGTSGGGQGGEGNTSCQSNCGGQGGTPNGGAGGNGNTGGMNVGGGGSVNVCTPSWDNPSCAGSDACACNDMPFQMPPQASCPYSTGNTCTPGHNQCGCDLPMGQDYVPADPTCFGFVNGDTWQDASGQFTDFAGEQFNENGQTQVGFGSLFGPEDGSYFAGLIMSGLTLQWNLANPMLERCSGTIAPDCKSVTLSCWHGGEANPYLTGTLYHVSQ